MPADEATDIGDLDLKQVLKHRGELSIVHHVPGRIRLRISRSLGAKARGTVDTKRVNRVIDAIDAIEDVRVNPAVGSVTITYDSQAIKPEWWSTLLHGDSEEAGQLLDKIVATVLAPALASAATPGNA